MRLRCWFYFGRNGPFRQLGAGRGTWLYSVFKYPGRPRPSTWNCAVEKLRFCLFGVLRWLLLGGLTQELTAIDAWGEVFGALLDGAEEQLTLHIEPPSAS
jgi:hypothetical protein